MWTSFADFNSRLLYLAARDEIILAEGTLPVCADMCAQRVPLRVMGNIRQS